MENEGETYREQKRSRVIFSECGLELNSGSMPSHMRKIHGRSAFVGAGDSNHTIREPTLYRISFPNSIHKIGCPVSDCPGTATSRDNLRAHFAFRHPDDSLCILEEGATPYPKCEQCGMHVSRLAQAQGHQNTKRCQSGTARRRQRAAIAEARRAREVVFSIRGVPLDAVDIFNDLGRPLLSVDDDWPAFHRNLTKARQKWGMIRRILAREGADPKVSGMFYKAVVQVVLLYGCETWNITSAMQKVLEGFHHRVARRLSGKLPYRCNGEWVYPPIEEALEEPGLYSIEHYINVRRRTLVQNVATRPIVELCKDLERLSGSSNRQYWWDQQQVENLFEGPVGGEEI